MAASTQHTCCSCCCGQAAALQQSVWDRPIWTTCDTVVAFQVSHTTLDSWRADASAGFPTPADLPGRSVRWWRDGVLGWFQTRHELANATAPDRPGPAPVEGMPVSTGPGPHNGTNQLPPVPRR